MARPLVRARCGSAGRGRRRRGDPRHLQPRGAATDRHVRPGAPLPRRPASWLASPVRRVRGRRRRPPDGDGHYDQVRRLRVLVALQGAGGVPHDGGGLGLRAAATARAAASARPCSSALLDVAEASGFHAVMARIEAGGERLPGPARGVRVRAGRRRAGGRPQVQPLARRGGDAVPAAGPPTALTGTTVSAASKRTGASKSPARGPPQGGERRPAGEQDQDHVGDRPPGVPTERRRRVEDDEAVQVAR